jgi:hypothetical protein
MPYIDWAVENGFGVIDVNVPVGTPRSAVSLSHATWKTAITDSASRTKMMW